MVLVDCLVRRMWAGQCGRRWRGLLRSGWGDTRVAGERERWKGEVAVAMGKERVWGD